MCALEACSVCECEDNEVPPAWRSEEQEECQSLLVKAEAESTVNRTLSACAEETLHALSGWKGLNNPWLPENDEDVEFSYINLLVNPERYTGYSGEHAHRIWNAIYSQNCFQNVFADDCDQESLVFYKIISGVHTSISIHLTKEYLLDESTNLWGVNLAEFRHRLADPARCDHVQNLYFVYLFVSRAVAKAAPALRKVHYHTGMPKEDAQTQALMRQILSSPALDEVCNLPFSVGRMWKGDSGPQLREQLQGHFQNITTIMDCVGCEKCKLWGKLQFLGVATSLKILFASGDCNDMSPNELLGALQLERNEVIALVNLLAKLSSSVATYRALSTQLWEEEGIRACFHADERVFSGPW